MEPGDKSHREICIESLPRRPHVVTFDNALSALKLVPGVKGRGAVLDGWTDPIGAHDKRVLEAEEAMFLEKDLVSIRILLAIFEYRTLCMLPTYVIILDSQDRLTKSTTSK